jgi:hypothetical protein
MPFINPSWLNDTTERPHYPKVGTKYRVFDATIEVTYAQHGSVVLSRGGKFEVQMSPREFWNWLDLKGAEVIA